MLLKTGVVAVWSAIAVSLVVYVCLPHFGVHDGIHQLGHGLPLLASAWLWLLGWMALRSKGRFSTAMLVALPVIALRIRQ